MSMTKIATVTVGAGGAASIDFTSIPQTFSDLKLKLSIRSSFNGTAVDGRIVFNGQNSNASGRLLYGQGSGAGAGGTYSSLFIWHPGAAATANTFSNTSITIPNYSSSNIKQTSQEIISENNTTFSYVMMFAGLWNSTSAITSISITDNNGGSWVAGSTATLYGVKNTAATAKATGGMITADANYIYHTFTASGTFTPTVALTADILTIAGGGGGGGDGSGGGGGGGGGLVYSSGQSISTAQSITVGAGGTGSTNGSNQTQGGSSQFGSLIAAVGGGRGGSGQGAGGNGGSGGGAGGWTSASGGTATSGQGFAGGNGPGQNNNLFIGSGGGGATAAGTTATTGQAPNGGAGTSAYSAWATATGVDVSGYFAGGGGGGRANGVATPSPGAGGAGGGGAGAAYPSTGSAGTASTGGGGGASGGNGGNGGSGVVIVRYPK
jgi:hypothetical protein